MTHPITPVKLGGWEHLCERGKRERGKGGGRRREEEKKEKRRWWEEAEKQRGQG